MPSRIPLPWHTAADGSFGFSPAGTTAPPWLPQPSDLGTWSAESEEVDPDSVLAFYRAAIARRREVFPTVGAFEFVDTPTGMVGFRHGDVTVLLNMTDSPLATPPAVHGRLVISSRGGHDDAAVVPPDTAVWLA